MSDSCGAPECSLIHMHTMNKRIGSCSPLLSPSTSFVGQGNTNSLISIEFYRRPCPGGGSSVNILINRHSQVWTEARMWIRNVKMQRLVGFVQYAVYSILILLSNNFSPTWVKLPGRSLDCFQIKILIKKYKKIKYKKVLHAVSINTISQHWTFNFEFSVH